MARVNLPNRITLSRLAASLALFVILFALQARVSADGRLLSWLAFATFVVTAATDWLDGYLARKRDEVTALGRMMDPFVDKVVVCGSLIFLTVMSPRLVPPWMVVVVVCREFLVSGIRAYMEAQGVAFGARMAGKVKMVLQCVAVSALLLLHAVGDPERGQPPWLAATCLASVWAALISTVYSGWVYARAFYASHSEL